MIYKRGGKGHENTARNPKVQYKRGAVANKIEEYKFLLEETVQQILHEIENDKSNPKKVRDHCIILCGFYFGLRIGEIPLLRRHHFKWIRGGYADIPTLKQRKKKGVKYNEWPPPVRIPGVESFVIDYVEDYLQNHMHPEQDFLFVSTSIHRQISKNMVDRIFNTYAHKVGLSNNYSWHALRHGRGVHCWQRFKPDLQQVQKMLRHSSIQATEIYMHLSPESRQDLLSKLNDSKSAKVKPLSRV